MEVKNCAYMRTLMKDLREHVDKGEIFGLVTKGLEFIVTVIKAQIGPAEEQCDGCEVDVGCERLQSNIQTDELE